MFLVKTNLLTLAEKGRIRIGDATIWPSLQADPNNFNSGFPRILFCDVDEARIMRAGTKIIEAKAMYQDGIHTARTSAQLMSTNNHERLCAAGEEPDYGALQEQYGHLSFCYLNENDEVCGMSLKFRRDHPERWILTFNQNVTAEAQDVLVKSYVHFESLNASVQEAMDNLGALQVTEMPNWQSPLPQFLIELLTKLFDPNEQVNVNLIDSIQSNVTTTLQINDEGLVVLKQPENIDFARNCFSIKLIEDPKFIQLTAQLNVSFAELERVLGQVEGLKKFKADIYAILSEKDKLGESFEMDDIKRRLHQARDKFTAKLDYNPDLHEVLKLVDTLIWIVTFSLAQR